LVAGNAAGLFFSKLLPQPMFSAARITALRKSQGLSQEALAEQSGVSLRTIQRVEQGDTLPRGHTMQALATALGVALADLRLQLEPEATPVLAAPEPAPTAAPAALPADPDFLQWLNLSALSFLVLPLLNLVVPWLLWRSRRHRVAHVAELGRRILGFQVLWQVATFFLMLLALAAQLVVFRHYQVALPELWMGLLLLTYGANVCTVIYYGMRLRQGRLDVYRYRL
jgi:transcriptional regulator with XRE-family HTH domain